MDWITIKAGEDIDFGDLVVIGADGNAFKSGCSKGGDMYIQPKEYCGGVAISRDLIDGNGPYGFYVRGGKKRIRNYGRDLKNGKGFQFGRYFIDEISKYGRNADKIFAGILANFF